MNIKQKTKFHVTEKFHPNGFLKCNAKSLTFIKLSDVCNAIIDCPNGNDELFCNDYICHNDCSCLNQYSLDCNSKIIDNKLENLLKKFKTIQLTNVSKWIMNQSNFQTIYLKIEKSYLIENNMILFVNLRILIIRHINKIKISKLPKYLQTLKIINSSLIGLNVNLFENSKYVKYLDLSLNKLRFLNTNIFKNINQLNELNLNFNNLNYLNLNIFKYTLKLENLFLENSFQYKNYKNFKNFHFYQFQNLRNSTFDFRIICCLIEDVKIKYEKRGKENFLCHSKNNDEFGVCFRFFKKNVFKAFNIILVIINIFLFIIFFLTNNYEYNKNLKILYIFFYSSFLFYNIYLIILNDIFKNNNFKFILKFQFSLSCKIIFIFIINLIFSTSFYENFLLLLKFSKKFKFNKIYFITILLIFGIFYIFILYFLSKNTEDYLLSNIFCHPLLSKDKFIKILCFIFIFFMNFSKIILYILMKKRKLQIYFVLKLIKYILDLLLTFIYFLINFYEYSWKINHIFIIIFQWSFMKIPFAINLKQFIERRRIKKIKKE